MSNFDRVIIDFEKEYIFETNGVIGLASQIENDRIFIDLPIITSQKKREASNELFKKILENINEAVFFDIDNLKIVLEKLNGHASLQVAKGILDNDKNACALIIRTKDKCAIAMSLDPKHLDEKMFYAPWQIQESEKIEND